MVFYTILNRKESEFYPTACEIGKVIELSGSDYSEFCKAPLYDYEFIREVADDLARDSSGISHGLLVLGEGHQDGIFVVPEGYSYARYAAHIPNARALARESQYPSLREYGEEMEKLADKCVENALQYQREGSYRILASGISTWFPFRDFSEELFAKMLTERKEIQYVDVDVEADAFYITLMPELTHAVDETQYKKLAQEDVDIMCTKHELWVLDAGGEQADFSGCLLDKLDLSHRNLNSAILSGAKLTDCNMNHCKLCFASCDNMKLVNCRAEHLTAEEASFRDAEFLDCDLTESFFTHSDFTQAQFPGSEMRCGSFQGCCLDSTGLDRIDTENLIMDGTVYDEQLWDTPASDSMQMQI